MWQPDFPTRVGLVVAFFVVGFIGAVYGWLEAVAFLAFLALGIWFVLGKRKQ